MIREEYTIEEVAERINKKEWELEFGYQYDGFQELLHTGWLWQDQQPYSLECRIFIRTKQRCNVSYRQYIVPLSIRTE